MAKKKEKEKTNTKTILLIVGLLIVCLIVGFTIGKYLFELTHPDIELLTKINI